VFENMSVSPIDFTIEDTLYILLPFKAGRSVFGKWTFITWDRNNLKQHKLKSIDLNIVDSWSI